MVCKIRQVEVITEDILWDKVADDKTWAQILRENCGEEIITTSKGSIRLGDEEFFVVGKEINNV